MPLRVAWAPQVKISKNSTLVLDGDNIVVDSLNLDGVLIVRATNGSRVVVSDLDVKTDKPWHFVELGAGSEGKDGGAGAAAAAVPEALRIRGYALHKPPGAHVEFVFADGVSHKLDSAALKAYAAPGSAGDRKSVV